MAATLNVITREQLLEVIDRIPNGVSLKKSCQISGIGYANACTRINADEELAKTLASARIDYQQLRVDELHEIAESVEDVQRARLMCDNIKWEAARISPKTYGDKQQHEHSGKDGAEKIKVENSIVVDQILEAGRNAASRGKPEIEADEG